MKRLTARATPRRSSGVQRGRRSGLHAALTGLIGGLMVGLLLLAGVALARDGRGAAKETRRAKPPAAVWDRNTAKTFQDDAFVELAGVRPDFAAEAVKMVSAGASQAAGAGNAGGASAGGAGGFKWSTLVSEETLTDEVKDLKGPLTAAVVSQSEFKGGGYDKARDAFSTVALVFGVIAAYDQDIRWQKHAETARDLFGRVGSNCKVGTDQSFAESKLRVADLEALLDGNPPNAKADRDEDFRWSQVAGRSALMSRLEQADGTLGAAIASKGDFDKALESVLHDAEIVAMIGEAIQRPDYEDHDDAAYVGYASTMRDAAVKMREAARKKDYDAARSALGELKKSCDACHGEYRG